MNSIYGAVLLLLGCFANASIYKTCQETGEVTKLLVNNVLVDKNMVILKKGQDAKLEIDFIPGNPSKNSTSVCHGIIGGIPVPFPVVKDGCKGLSPHCPLKKGANEVFTAAISVKAIYPSLKLLIKWEEVGDDGKDIVCLIIPAEIQG